MNRTLLMKYTFLLITIFYSTLAFSQSKTYLDENKWKTKKRNAKYIQEIVKMESKVVLKESLLENNQLLSETTLQSASTKIKHGEYKAYYKNGTLRESGQYYEDKKHGDWEEFYEDGVKKMIYQVREDKRLYNQYWDKEGNSILVNGNGTLSQQNEKQNELSVTIFRDSLMYSIYSVRRASNDTIYDLATKPAEFENGFPAFYQKIGKTMKYPNEARRNGVMGRVYIQFIVNEKGQLKEVKSIKGIGSGCDEEAEKAVRNSSGAWIPAEFEGKKVKARMILPITFRLG